MPTNLVVFDIDGTLVNSAYQHHESIDYAFKKMNCLEIDRNWFGYDHVTDNHIFSKVFKQNNGRPATAEDIKEFEQHALDKLMELPKMKEIAGAKDLVQKVWDNDDWDLTFATGSLYRIALKKLGDAGVKFKPSLVIASNQIESREGLIEAAEEAAKRFFQVNNYDKILSCGDALWDVRTAKNLNLPLLGIGLEHKEKLMSEGIKHHVDDWTTVDIPFLNSIVAE